MCVPDGVVYCMCNRVAVCLHVSVCVCVCVVLTVCGLWSVCVLVCKEISLAHCLPQTTISNT